MGDLHERVTTFTMPNTAYPRRTNGLPGPPPSNGHASHPPHPPPSNAPPPLSLVHSGPPPQGPSVLQILAMGQERNHAADSIAHHPRIESLVKLGKESEATWLQIGKHYYSEFKVAAECEDGEGPLLLLSGYLDRGDI